MVTTVLVATNDNRISLDFLLYNLNAYPLYILLKKDFQMDNGNEQKYSKYMYGRLIKKSNIS